MHSFRHRSASTFQHSLPSTESAGANIPADCAAWALTASRSLLKALSMGPTSFVESLLAKRCWKGNRWIGLPVRRDVFWEIRTSKGRKVIVRIGLQGIDRDEIARWMEVDRVERVYGSGL